jgi:hypothetical protein
MNGLTVVAGRPGRQTFAKVLTLALVLGSSIFALSFAPARDVPTKLTDQAFWDLVTSFSEEGGFFASNNWVSNETQYQHVVPRLAARIKPGGVYVGVGPDQNFTYLVGLRPALAFIVDIRRQNLLHHLMYKAMIEMSPTRADFVSRLFGRPRPASLKDDATPDALFAAFMTQAPSAELINQTCDDMLDRLVRQHGFTLSENDRSTLLTVYQAFYSNGPGITYTGVPSYVTMAGDPAFQMQSRMSPFPGFSDLMGMTDGAGINRSYLANEEHYKVLRDMELRNAIVPVVGDFAGPKALQAVGKYVRDRGAKVTALYTSNVEQYLFQNNVWRKYYDNVASMPLDETSSFIRSFFQSGAGGVTIITRGGVPQIMAPPQTFPQLSSRGSPFIASLQLTCSAKELIAAVAEGRIVSYADVINFSK